jgi:hypothetical protein
MPLYHGRDAAIYVSTSATGTASRLLTMTAWTMDRSTDRVDVTNFDSINQEELQGWPALRGTFEGYWNSDETKLFAAANSADGIKMYLYPTARVPSKYVACTAWLDASVETRVDGATRVRGSYSAFGPGSVVNL